MKPPFPANAKCLPEQAIPTSVAGRLVTIFIALLISGSVIAQQKTTLLFLMSDNSSPYQIFKETLQGIKKEKRLNDQEWLFVDLKKASIQDIQELTDRTETIISVGDPAAKIIASLEYENRHITTFISKDAYKKTSNKYNKHKEKTCGLVIDQPVKRIITATRTYTSNISRFSIITSSQSDSRKSEVFQIYDVSAVIYQPLLDNIHTTIKKISEAQIDAIIATHDPEIYNQHTARTILITSYHFNIPIIGFSSSFVKAGAFIGVYSKPESLAEDVYHLIESPNRCANGTTIYPSIYTVEINKQVAKSLGINTLSDFQEKTFNARQ